MYRDKNWQTPFHIAAANNACACAELIIPRLSNINISDRAGRTSLHQAANAGHTDMVRLLIQHGANVNAADKRERRPLHWAAANHHEEVVELLVSAGAEVNARDKEQLNTPLHAAAAGAAGGFGVVATLLELGADMTARNAAGNTPAHTAALNGHVEALEEMLAAGFDMDGALNKAGQTVLHLAAVAPKVRPLAWWLSQAYEMPKGYLLDEKN
jgi:serine/threonine-protein phosphatase 6 regulatory ankyrin repeat subunit A